jgi:hypothetical protein
MTAPLAGPNLPVFLPSVSSTLRPANRGTVRIIGAVRIDGVGHLVMAVGLPDLEVVRAVAGRGVHETGTGVVGDVVAGQQGHGEAITRIQRRQRVSALQSGRIEVVDAGPKAILAALKTSSASLSATISRSPVWPRVRTPARSPSP